jgi:hypothetical protein
METTDFHFMLTKRGLTAEAFFTEVFSAEPLSAEPLSTEALLTKESDTYNFQIQMTTGLKRVALAHPCRNA